MGRIAPRSRLPNQLRSLGQPRAAFATPPRSLANVGVVPRLRQSGKRAFFGARGLPLGNARLRHRLWMPTLVAVRKNPWLRARDDRLLAAGKRPKGRDRGLYAKVARRDLQRRAQPAPFCTPLRQGFT
jgi:Transposase IS116/IS110/IS902 family